MNIILTGVKGSGKSMIEKLLTNKNLGFSKIISYTTREPRNGEVDGEDYFFISQEEFNEMKDNEVFAEMVTFLDNNYGILKSTLLNDKDNVMVVEINGLKQILNNIPREELFIIKMDCDINEQLQRILERDKLTDYDKVFKLLEKLKEDREYFKQKYEYDYYINTTDMYIDDVLGDILLVLGAHVNELEKYREERCNLA